MLIERGLRARWAVTALLFTTHEGACLPAVPSVQLSVLQFCVRPSSSAAHLFLCGPGMWQSVKRITYVSDNWGIAVRIPAETRFFPSPKCPDRHWPLRSAQWWLLPRRKWPLHETNHSPPHNAGVNEWRCTSTPPIRLYGMCTDCFTCCLTSHLYLYCRIHADSAACRYPYECTNCST